MKNKRQSIDTNTVTKILNNKDFKVVLTKTLQQVIKNMLKTNEKISAKRQKIKRSEGNFRTEKYKN